MKKYNVKNYIRYKEDVKRVVARIPIKDYVDYTDEELKVIISSFSRKCS